MNYYEELGIGRDATIWEIREAYKLAARLLHPDLQQDQRLKELAEREMRRLGGVVAVLTDPRERARYDAGLGDGARLRPPARLARASRPEFLQTVVRHWFWILLGSTTVGMGTWYAFARSTAVPGARPAAESARTAAGPPARAARPVPERRRPVKAPDNAGSPNVGQKPPLRARVMETTEPSLTAPTPLPAEIPDEAARVEPGIVAPQQKARVAEVAHDSDESPFEGEWLYAADGQREDRTGSYPARYVEFRLRTESGTLVGDYRALHTLVDKAISPEVVLRVRGESPRRNTGTLDWESSNGARGQLELTLRSPNQLQVKWWTTQFGKQEALTSGMAVLIRLRTP